jgi:hypothetical protein
MERTSRVYIQKDIGTSGVAGDVPTRGDSTIDRCSVQDDNNACRQYFSAASCAPALRSRTNAKDTRKAGT